MTKVKSVKQVKIPQELDQAVKERFGKSAYVRYNSLAPDGPTRDEWRVLNQEANNRIKQIKQELEVKSYPSQVEALMKAAEVAIDSLGDTTRMSELANAVRSIRVRQELLREQQRLIAEVRERPVWHRRWTALIGRPIGNVQICDADTEKGLLEAIKTAKKPGI